MKTYCLLLLPVILLAISSCKEKNRIEEDKKFISVLSLIEKQVAHIDTSLYAITKIVYTDSLHSDTSYIRREDFRSAAKEFLDIPDLSEKKVAKKYKEETRYDELLNRVIITYTPLNADKEEIQKQEILVTPNLATGDKVNNIIINSVKNDRNGYLEKNMLWLMDKSFQIVTTSQQPGQPEITTTTKVTWNEDSYK
jgi:hypothetical protein